MTIKRNKSGLTLIELMLVVIILSVLISMVAPRFFGRSKEAHIVAARTVIQSNMAIALDLYELDNGRYPDSLEGLWTHPGQEFAPKWRGPYLKKKNRNDPWNNPYQYRYPGEHNIEDYDLFSLGPDGQVSDDDITNWEENGDL